MQGGSYSHLKPCTDTSGSRAIQLDTEHGPGWVNGTNDVKICGYDVGGNSSHVCAGPCRWTIRAELPEGLLPPQLILARTSAVSYGGGRKSPPTIIR